MKIIQLDPSYDLWLSYTWSNNNHGVCGHTFEVFDYYHVLKDHFKVGIFLGEDIDWQTVERSIRNKYDFTDHEIADIRAHTVFGNRPSLLRGRNILFTDGGIVNAQEYTLLFDNIIFFACGNKEIKDNDKHNVYILQDDRVYDPVKTNGINYKKKILFSRLKTIGESKNQILLYATKNCRNIKDWADFARYNKPIVAITNAENQPTPVTGITFILPPVDNLFEQFTTYVYTPVERKWDCSPRFIAECKYYSKEVIYHDIDYWAEDLGLYWRRWDIDYKFDSIHLKPNDEIVDILKGII
jgi:hypothetical protein